MSAEIVSLAEYRAQRRCSGAADVNPAGDFVVGDWASLLAAQAAYLELQSIYLLQTGLHYLASFPHVAKHEGKDVQEVGEIVQGRGDDDCA